MKKIMPLVASIMLILVAGMFAGAGTMAIFSDTEKVSVADVSAGTLDLKLNGADAVIPVDIHDIAPGWSQIFTWTLKNTGTIAGKVSVSFSAITNLEGAVTEPELDAEDDPYTYFGAGPTLGRAEGELGEYLKTTLSLTDQNQPHFVHNTNTGPPGAFGGWHHYGLDACGGNTYDAKVTLGPDGTTKICLTLSLDTNLTAWDACASHDIDDNVIQGDAVYFDIIFHLDQVVPP